MATRKQVGAGHDDENTNENGDVETPIVPELKNVRSTARDHLRALENGLVKPIKPISLPKLEIQTIMVDVVGDSELICHNWSEKAVKQMLDKQMGKATAGREKKDPEQDFRDSLYPHPDGGYGFPTIAFKSAAVSACTSLGKSVTKVAARQAFHVLGELVKIEGTPRMRRDNVRLAQQTADIRFRAGFPEWRTTLTIRYNTRVLTSDQIINMLNTAGFAVGVGEWRSECDGQYGLFHCV